MITDPPKWPPALRDDTPLPFSAWRVMHQVDGVKHLITIANTLDITIDDVHEALEQSESWTERAQKREQVITETIIENVNLCLINVVGPMGEFIVDDALDEVGENTTLSRLLSSIAAQLDETHLHAFVRQLRSKGLA